MAKIAGFLVVLAVLAALAPSTQGRSLTTVPVNATGGDNAIYFLIHISYTPEGGSNDDYCLDVGTGDDAGVAIVAPCTGASTQLWGIDGGKVTNFNGKCLDVCKGWTCWHLFKAATEVIVYECNGGKNQKWYSKGHSLVSVYNNDCLDFCHSDKCKPLESAVTYTCDEDSADQDWSFSLTPVPEEQS